jgi:hypothetical protein
MFRLVSFACRPLSRVLLGLLSQCLFSTFLLDQTFLVFAGSETDGRRLISEVSEGVDVASLVRALQEGVWVCQTVRPFMRCRRLLI